MNTADIVIICILAAAVAAATVFKGKCIGCSGNCAACAASSNNKNADLKKL